MLSFAGGLLRGVGDVRIRLEGRERVARDGDEGEDEHAREDEDEDAVEESADDVADHASASDLSEESPALARCGGGTQLLSDEVSVLRHLFAYDVYVHPLTFHG